MKKFVCYILILCFTLSWTLLLWWNTFSLFDLWNSSSILTRDSSDVVDTTLWVGNEDISDPLRQWAYTIIHSVSWTTVDWIVWVDDEIQTHSEAMVDTLQVAKNIINMLLWFLALIALIYVIVHWIMILLSWSSDDKFKKGIKWIKRAIIAIVWIWLSWFIITLIFWFIRWISS
jgi:hypothetical protein